jgi:hypothetical protein
MSETPQDQEGGYGYPTLEQEVTPEVLEAGSDEPGASTGAGTGPEDDEDDADVARATPGDLVDDPSPVEPTD